MLLRDVSPRMGEILMALGYVSDNDNWFFTLKTGDSAYFYYQYYNEILF
jgi:hypothetical protein